MHLEIDKFVAKLSNNNRFSHLVYDCQSKSFDEMKIPLSIFSHHNMAMDYFNRTFVDSLESFIKNYKPNGWVAVIREFVGICVSHEQFMYVIFGGDPKSAFGDKFYILEAISYWKVYIDNFTINPDFYTKTKEII